MPLPFRPFFHHDIVSSSHCRIFLFLIPGIGKNIVGCAPVEDDDIGFHKRLRAAWEMVAGGHAKQKW